MTPAELNEKYTDFRIYGCDGYLIVSLLTHRRCGCLVTDPDAHEKVCFDPPVQLEPVSDQDRYQQRFHNYLIGERYS